MTFAQSALPRKYTEATSPAISMTNSRRHREKAGTMVQAPIQKLSGVEPTGMNLTNVDDDVD